MKNLILIRHGKSNWNVPVGDHERPLNQRGVTNSHLVFENLSKVLPKRFLIWCSSARRTLDTAKIFTETLSIPNDLVIVRNELYTFDWKELYDEIANCKNDIQNLVVFGHNSAITDFVNKFGNKFIENVPTSGGIILKFKQNSWQDISEGEIEGIYFPKRFKYVS